MARAATRSRPNKNSPALNPATPSLAYREMHPRWALINAVLGGTETMRLAGEHLMPKHEGESQLHYDDRLSSAVLTNFLRLTVEFLVGKPYSEKAKFRDSTPPSLKALETDIDYRGNDLTSVTKDFFFKGMAKGFAYLMVEYPGQNQEEMTLADIQTAGLRPYWCVITPELVLSERTARINGKETFTHLRIFNTQTEPNGYDEVAVNRIFEYNLIPGDPNNKDDGDFVVTVTVHRQMSQKNNDWQIEQAPVQMRLMNRIPCVKFQTNADGRPELLDEAYLNTAHWQSSSDQSSCLTMARFPILAGSGVDEQNGRVIGPYELLVTSDPTAKFYYVEHNGIAIGVGSGDIAALEDKMAMYGAELLKKRPGRETATARTIDEVQSMAPLQIIVLQFMSALEQACDYTLQWLQDPTAQDENTYGVDVNLDFAMTDDQQRQMTWMENARLQGDVSREQFFAAAKMLGYMPESFNITKNQSELAVERQDYLKQLEAIAAAKPDPSITGAGGPINDLTPAQIKKSATVTDRNKTSD